MLQGDDSVSVKSKRLRNEKGKHICVVCGTDGEPLCLRVSATGVYLTRECDARCRHITVEALPGGVL